MNSFSKEPEAGEDSLIAFAEWFLSQPMALLEPPQLPVLSQGPVAHIVLYRDGQYQVEQYTILQKNAVFPPHRHPHVDTLEVGLVGDMLFTIEGTPTPSNTILYLRTPFDQIVERKSVRIRPHEEHWVRVGASGGAFLSIQHWIGGSPTSVVLDWDGPTFGRIHAENVKNTQQNETH